jgi:branched-chain amino acid transport system ATP-binding protein
VTALLQVENLCKHFGGLRAVDSVDLELHEGEILGVIGPNGAGKTTLFSVIGGSMPPTSGRVLLNGRKISGLPANRVVRAGVCRTHQIVRPFSSLTVFENVHVGALYGPPPICRLGRSPRHETIEILDFVGLLDRSESLPGSLTLAGRKRLELARALATRPRVLLLDEVAAGLNPVESQRLTDLVRQVRDDRGVSIVMIEHVMQAVMRLSDRVAVLDYGRKIAVGTPDSVSRDERVIAAYLGQAAAERQAGGPEAITGA